MPSYTLDETIARELDAMAARRGVPPEALLAELITRAAGHVSPPRMQQTLTTQQLKVIDEDKRQYWVDRQEEEHREEKES